MPHNVREKRGFDDLKQNNEQSISDAYQKAEKIILNGNYSSKLMLKGISLTDEYFLELIIDYGEYFEGLDYLDISNNKIKR